MLVLGAHGFFGRHAVTLLRAEGIAAVPIGHDQADVEDRASLRALVHVNDVLLDTVGPFQRRTHALLDVALEQHADLVDLSDSASYARSIGERSADIAAKGMAVLMVSSDLQEVLGIADRVLVMREGSLVAQLDRDEATQERVMLAATGQAVPA